MKKQALTNNINWTISLLTLIKKTGIMLIKKYPLLIPKKKVIIDISKK